MSTFYIADLHFGHKNVLAYDNREFPNIEEHDKALIEKWNSVVGVNDDVWILGDISWHSEKETLEILHKLKGKKHLCAGNHDWKFLKNNDIRKAFVEIVDYKEICSEEGIGLVLSHYPIPCFNHHFKGWVHLYGHVHNSFEWNMMKEVKYQMEALYEKKCRMYNVGCMIPGMDYTPKTLSQILDLFEKSS